MKAGRVQRRRSSRAKRATGRASQATLGTDGFRRKVVQHREQGSREERRARETERERMRFRLSNDAGPMVAGPVDHACTRVGREKEQVRVRESAVR